MKHPVPMAATLFAVCTVSATALAFSLPAGAADLPANVPLPEAEYQAARRDAVNRFASAVSACGFVNWSSRGACEQTAAQQYQQAEQEAKRRFVQSQAALSTLVRNPDGRLRKDLPVQSGGGATPAGAAAAGVTR